MNEPIGRTLGTGPRGPFRMNMRPHTWCVGQSGVGKSTFMTNAAIDLIQQGYGITSVDPHTDNEKILRYIPRHRMNDVIIIDPLADYVPGIIPQYNSIQEQELFIQAVVGMLRSIHRDRWGDETERIIMGALDATTEYYGRIDLVAVALFIARDSFRQKMLAASKNPILADFREQYDEKLRDSEQMSKFSPPLNKTDEFLRPVMRPLMSHEKSIDFARAMDDKRIILVNVSKGKLGREVASLIGSLVLANIAIMAMRRSPESPQHFVFVDECQSFISEYEVFLAELRKFNVSLVLATQYLSNFTELAAVFGNAPNGTSYRVAGVDAKAIEENFLEDGLSKLIVNLSNYEFRAHTISKSGVPVMSGLIRARAKIKKLGNEPPAGAVIAESLRRWGSPRAAIDEKMLKFIAQ
jgi:hypothetical protein